MKKIICTTSVIWVFILSPKPSFSDEISSLQNIICPSIQNSFNQAKRNILDKTMHSVFKVYGSYINTNHNNQNSCLGSNTISISEKCTWNSSKCQCRKPLGTASLISRYGHVITANHVIKDNYSFSLKIPLDIDSDKTFNIGECSINNSCTELEKGIIKKDALQDYAILKINKSEWEESGSLFNPIVIHYSYQDIDIDNNFHLLGYKELDEFPSLAFNVGSRSNFLKEHLQGSFGITTHDGQSGSLLLSNSGVAYGILKGNTINQNELHAFWLFNITKLLTKIISGNNQNINSSALNIIESILSLDNKVSIHKSNVLMRNNWDGATFLSYSLLEKLKATIKEVSEITKNNSGGITNNSLIKAIEKNLGDIKNLLIMSSENSISDLANILENERRLSQFIECTLSKQDARYFKNALNIINIINITSQQRPSDTIDESSSFLVASLSIVSKNLLEDEILENLEPDLGRDSLQRSLAKNILDKKSSDSIATNFLGINSRKNKITKQLLDLNEVVTIMGFPNSIKKDSATIEKSVEVLKGILDSKESSQKSKKYAASAALGVTIDYKSEKPLSKMQTEIFYESGKYIDNPSDKNLLYEFLKNKGHSEYQDKAANYIAQNPINTKASKEERIKDYYIREENKIVQEGWIKNNIPNEYIIIPSKKSK